MSKQPKIEYGRSSKERREYMICGKEPLTLRVGCKRMWFISRTFERFDDIILYFCVLRSMKDKRNIDM